MCKKSIVFLLLACNCPLFAQSTLSLADVFRMALSDNQDIEIAQEQTAIERQRVFKSNAGMTPIVSTQLNGEYVMNNTSLELNTFGPEGAGTQEISEDLAGSMQHSARVRIDYTLLDWGRGKKTLKQLENYADLAALQQQLITDNTLLGVAQLYLTIVNLERRHDLLVNNTLISKERIERATLNDRYAKGNQLMVLRAKVDLNTDSIRLKNLERDLKNAKKDLLRFLNISNLEQDFSTLMPGYFASPPDWESLKATALNNNPEILLAAQNIVISSKELEIMETESKPQISVFGATGFSRQDYEVNQIRYAQNIGPSAGFQITNTLYDGKRRRRNQEIQKLTIDQSNRRLDQTQARILLELNKAWTNYQALESQLDFERQNLQFYEENLRRTQLSFAAAKATDLDLRDAQQSLLNAQQSIANKATEIQQTYFTMLAIAGIIQEPINQ